MNNKDCVQNIAQFYLLYNLFNEIYIYIAYTILSYVQKLVW